MNINKSENTFILGLFLTLTGVIAAVLLAYFAKLTEGPIKEAAEIAAGRSLASVMPQFESKKSTKVDEILFTVVFDSKNSPVGVAGETAVKGYGGEIKTLVGMNMDGSIRSVVITKHNETPGLGGNVCVRKENRTISNIFDEKTGNGSLPPNQILDSYNGRSIKAQKDQWKIKKDGGDCEFLTGATISSRAICNAVYNVVSIYNENREKIMDSVSSISAEDKK